MAVQGYYNYDGDNHVGVSPTYLTDVSVAYSGFTPPNYLLSADIFPKVPVERGVMTREEQLKRQIERAESELERLAKRPKEPEDDGAVVYIDVSFKNNSYNNKNYTYIAHKAGNGMWYLSGNKSPNGVTWDYMLDWFDNHNQNAKINEMWLVSEYERLV